MINAGYLDKLAKVESGNNPLAQNPKSSAKGRFQFINDTAKQYGLDQHDFGTPEYEQAEKQAAVKLTQDNFEYLQKKLNRAPTEGELYLAHQQGAGGAEKILMANQNEKAVNVLGKDQVLNNGGTEDMTVAEFAQKWTSKFDKGENNVDADRKTGNVSTELGDIDALFDFGVNADSGDVDALSDFSVGTEDAFLSQDDGTGGLKKSMIDQSSGAPSYIRQVVGTLYDPTSRLATLQKYYPDAQPYGKDNFVFTNPETKKPTLYNPEGLDTGDIASITKEGFVTVGSGMGGVVGTVGGPFGAVIGAGLGAGIASNVYDAWMTITGQTRDIRTGTQRVSETAGEVVTSALGEGAGRALPVMAKNAFGGGKAASRQIIAQMEKFGITPSAAVAFGSKSGMAEAALSQNIGSADIILKQADDIVAQSHEALNKIVVQYGKPKTQQGAGKVIQEAAEAVIARSKDTKEILYDKAYNLVGRGTPANLVNTSNLQKELARELMNAQESKKRALSPAIERVKAIVADAQNGLDFDTLRSIRTDIRKDLKDPLSSGATASQNLALQRVYDALTFDMDETAKAVSPEAFSAIKRADKYTMAFAKTAEKTLNKILKYDAEEKAYTFALSASKDGGSSLMKLRKLFTEDEWGDVSATVLSELGHDVTNDGFSVAKFVTNYNKLAPEAKAALFKGGKNQKAGQALDEFVDLMGLIKDKSRYENTSRTGGAIQSMTILNSMGIGLASAATGDVLGVTAVGGIALSTAGARGSAYLLTKPEFVKWMAEPVKEGTKDWSAHLTKLIAIGEANPEIKDAIGELLINMQKITAPENTNEKQK